MTEQEREEIKQRLNQIMIHHQNSGTDFKDDSEFIELFSKLAGKTSITVENKSEWFSLN